MTKQIIKNPEKTTLMIPKDIYSSTVDVCLL